MAARTLPMKPVDERRIEGPLVVFEGLESALIENVAHRRKR